MILTSIARLSGLLAISMILVTAIPLTAPTSNSSSSTVSAINPGYFENMVRQGLLHLNAYDYNPPHYSLLTVSAMARNGQGYRAEDFSLFNILMVDTNHTMAVCANNRLNEGRAWAIPREYPYPDFVLGMAWELSETHLSLGDALQRLRAQGQTGPWAYAAAVRPLHDQFTGGATQEVTFNFFSEDWTRMWTVGSRSGMVDGSNDRTPINDSLKMMVGLGNLTEIS